MPKGGERVGDRLGGRAYYDVITHCRHRARCVEVRSHSMRSGWISTAARNGASVWKMKEISRHKRTDVHAGYVREAELFQQQSVWSGLDGVFPLVHDLAAQAEQVGGFAVDRAKQREARRRWFVATRSPKSR
jgi:hypothetical protein